MIKYQTRKSKFIVGNTNIYEFLTYTDIFAKENTD